MIEQNTKNKKNFILEVELNGEIKKYKSETIIGCLDLMGKPIAYKTKGIFNLKYGIKKAQILLNTFQIRRLLVNSLSKQILEKRFLSILK